MDLAMGLGNPDPDLGGAVSHAWVYLTKEIVFGGSVIDSQENQRAFQDEATGATAEASTGA
jgi:hypothetical protein